MAPESSSPGAPDQPLCPGCRTDRSLRPDRFCTFCARMYRKDDCQRDDCRETAATLRSLGRCVARMRNERTSLRYCLERLYNRVHVDESGCVEFDASEPEFSDLLEQISRLLNERVTL